MLPPTLHQDNVMSSPARSNQQLFTLERSGTYDTHAFSTPKPQYGGPGPHQSPRAAAALTLVATPGQNAQETGETQTALSTKYNDFFGMNYYPQRNDYRMDSQDSGPEGSLKRGSKKKRRGSKLRSKTEARHKVETLFEK